MSGAASRARGGLTRRIAWSAALALSVIACLSTATTEAASSSDKQTRSLAKSMKNAGVVPLEGRSELAVSFEYRAAGKRGEATFAIRTPNGRSRDWSKRADVRVAPFSDDGAVEGAAIFAGYGLVLPNDGYESYSDADVEGKIVVVLDGAPSKVAAADRSEMLRNASPRNKAVQAAARGARAILFVTDGDTAGAAAGVGLVEDGFVALHVTPEVASALFEGSDHGSLEELRAALDTGNPHVGGFEFSGLELTVEARVDRETRTTHHVVGRAPAAADSSVATAGTIVVGTRASSVDGARTPGTELLLALGRRLADEPAAQQVVLAIWSGETGDASGSAAFVAEGALESRGLLGYINLQTDSSTPDNRLRVESVGSSPVWARLIERVNVVAGFDIEMLEDPWLPADSESYYAAGVPAINLFTGPTDEERGSLEPGSEDFDRLVGLTEGLVRRLASLEQRPEFVEVARVSDGETDAHDPARPFTGTVPDYAADVEGLRLDGVIEGGPADEAGLREGDIITKFGDHTIGDVYDYVDALADVKIDVPVLVTFTRDGKSMDTTVTPRARE